MAASLWANLIDFYQHPGCDRSTLEKMVRQGYLPLIRIFEQNPKSAFSLNLPGSTVELLIRTGFGNVVKKVAALAEKGQADIAMTPNFQPLIPYHSDDDIDRQIELHNKICKRYLGINYRPQGLYSPFLAYSQKVSKAGARFALKWVAVDENSVRGRSKNGFNSLYMDKSAGGILLMPCRREISYLLGGTYRAGKIPRSGAEFFQMSAKQTSKDKYFITKTEARNFGFDNPGRHGLLRALLRDSKLRSISVTQLRRYVKRKDFVKGIEVAEFSQGAGSKKNKPYVVWDNPKNPIQQTLWKLHQMGAAEIKNAASRGDPQYMRAREMFDSASAGINWTMASCSPWWDKRYPQRAADDLAIAVFVLLSSPPKAKDQAIDLRVKLYEQVEQFEKSGDHKKLQKSYLKASNIQFDRFRKQS
jgi:hypothetical protein